ncbi:hypothetical protein K435DRAFT_853932 [Dendrothele bispora CBS 962.96]|uniref:Uncharacterized protein n=1 Tax=Dendrothele bispora (strain CBS 962.96) TaxID=1314807 RepID=A0A4S8MF13_DENBC|nr:hypothetical protein K435DRAFT_853932 [Dendrothele bispora CBS 962.96]
MPHPVAPIAASGTSISSSCSCRAIVKAKPLGSLPANFVGMIPTPDEEFPPDHRCKSHYSCWKSHRSGAVNIATGALGEEPAYLLKVDHEQDPVQPCPQVTPP